MLQEHLTAARAPLNHQGLHAEALLAFFRISAHLPQPLQRYALKWEEFLTVILHVVLHHAAHVVVKAVGHVLEVRI